MRLAPHSNRHGDVSTEAELLDSSTSEVFAAAMDFEVGKKYRVDQAMSKWGHVKVAIEHWAKLLHDRLEEFSGKKIVGVVIRQP